MSEFLYCQTFCTLQLQNGNCVIRRHLKPTENQRQLHVQVLEIRHGSDLRCFEHLNSEILRAEANMT